MVNQMDLTIVVSAVTLILIGLVLLPFGISGKTGWVRIAWGLGDIAHGIGWLLTVTPGYSSSPVRLILANLFLTAALGLLWSGTALFTHVHRSALLLLMPSLVTLVTFPVFVYITPSLPARVVIASIISAIGCGDSGRMLMRDRHRPTRLLGYALIGVSLLQALRGAGSLVAIWYPEPLVAIIYTDQMPPATLLVFTVWTVGMLVSSADRSEEELRELVTGLTTASLTDQLTELHNRRFMQQRLEEAKKRLDQRGEVFSVLILDIDHFKQINDSHGHEAGDLALQLVAQTLQMTVGDEHLLARWGGEEFVILMPNTGAERAQQVAEHLRYVLSLERADYGDASFHITVTIGGTTGSPNQTVAEVIRRADRALYQGKQLGRNRVTWA